jgi:ribonucleoside-diphosphate reductase beta chain
MSMLTLSNPPATENPYPWVAPIQQAMWDGFWTARKFTFDSDITDFRENMTDAQREFVLRNLAAIAQIEVKVKKFWAFLGMHIKDDTITGGAITMAGVEEIHNDAYKRLLLKLGVKEKIEEVLNVPVIANRVGYLTKHTLPVYQDENPGKQVAYSVTLFTLFVEYISLFAAFSNILHLDRDEKMLKDTAQQVKYTRNEETLHAHFGVGIIRELRREYPEIFDADFAARVYEEATVAYEAESRLIDWMFEGYEHPNHSPEMVKNYIRERFNEALEMIGYEGVFTVDPDLSKQTLWMKVGVVAPPKVDFFHSEPIGYVQADRPDDDDF